MLPTYVFGWPTGKETGDYLAIDLGMCGGLYSKVIFNRQ